VLTLLEPGVDACVEIPTYVHFFWRCKQNDPVVGEADKIGLSIGPRRDVEGRDLHSAASRVTCSILICSALFRSRKTVQVPINAGALACCIVCLELGWVTFLPVRHGHVFDELQPKCQIRLPPLACKRPRIPSSQTIEFEVGLQPTGDED